MLNFLNKIVSEDVYQIFLAPVTREQAPDYYNFIQYPTDMRLITLNILKGIYKHPQEMRNDFELMIKNAILFNNPRGPIWDEAFRILKKSNDYFILNFGYTYQSCNTNHISKIKTEQELLLKITHSEDKHKEEVLPIIEEHKDEVIIEKPKKIIGTNSECYYHTEFEIMSSKLRYYLLNIIDI